MQFQGGKPARKQARPLQSLQFSGCKDKYRFQFYKNKYISDGIKYLGYLVRPGLAVAAGVGLPEVLVALIQFGGDDQIACEEQHAANKYRLTLFLLVNKEKIVEEMMMLEVFIPFICLVKYFCPR